MSCPIALHEVTETLPGDGNVLSEVDLNRDGRKEDFCPKAIGFTSAEVLAEVPVNAWLPGTSTDLKILLPRVPAQRVVKTVDFQGSGQGSQSITL